MLNFKKAATSLVLAALTTTLMTATSVAQTPEQFYEGKTLRFMSTTGAGGTMDLYLLLTMKHIEKHLPASTDVVLEHRPGAGGALGLNYLFQAAPKDGTVVGMPTPSMVTNTFANPDSIRYNPSEFQSLGRIVDLPRVYVARGDSGLESMEDAVNASGDITHSIMTVGTSLDQYMTVANLSLGTQFRRVAGYSGGGPAFLAMEQGEVQSTSAEPANLFSNKWHLVESGEVNVLAVGALERMEELPDTPSLLELIDESNDYYDITRAVFANGGIGLSVIAPPGVPADRMAYLREVFWNTMTDPEFIAEAEERGIPINPREGEWLDTLIGDAANVPEPVKTWFFDMANAN